MGDNAVKIVIFGLAVSSSWGNGHATLWRGLCGALGRRGHQTVFFERDQPYYAAHRDMTDIPGVRLVLYPDWTRARQMARAEVEDADAAIVTSYCPDGVAATDLVLDRAKMSVFYDLDTPVTLDVLNSRGAVSYIGPLGLRGFDLVLSYTGGKSLDALAERLGARRVEPLYGSVDPAVHRPVPPIERFRADLSYLGTYAEDRQPALERLFLEPAARSPEKRFLLGGSLYPEGFHWRVNIGHIEHVPPGEHSAFYCSSRLTLSVTRRAMAAMGYCPSGRLFEAAACGVPILSDSWNGMALFFEPEREILLAASPEETCAALELSDAELCCVARAARERTLGEHTAMHRARQLEALLWGGQKEGT